MDKNPGLTCGDWLHLRWSHALIKYALEDVVFLAEAISIELSRRKFGYSELNDLAHSFPEKFKASKSRSKKSNKRNKFEFCEDNDEDDDHDMRKVMRPLTTKERDEQDKARRKAVVEDQPFV